MGREEGFSFYLNYFIHSVKTCCKGDWKLDVVVYKELKYLEHAAKETYALFIYFFLWSEPATAEKLEIMTMQK